jgi:prolyl 4-hydroxylase
MTMPSTADPEAQYALGTGLLARPDSRETFVRGAALIEAAAAQGHAEATCLLATMEAIGAGRHQDWSRAFDQLRNAAELGSEQAAGQLRLLGGDGGGFEIAALLRIQRRRMLSERPRLFIFEGFASPAECRWVISRFRPRMMPALVWDEASGLGKVDPGRTSSAVELWLTEMDVVTEVLRARIAAATGLSEALFEVPQVMHYSVGQEFHWHHDYLDPEGLAAEVAHRGQRTGTFLIYLNEDFDGGETEFPDAGLSYRGRTGDGLFFANVLPDGRPDPLTVHAGRPPSRGEKWIFSQWIRDRAPG